jgi:hypothetical protein
MTEKGRQIFASSPADDQSVEEAKKFIKKHGLTSEDVGIFLHKEDDKAVAVVVVAKRHIELRLPGQEEIFE